MKKTMVVLIMVFIMCLTKNTLEAKESIFKWTNLEVDVCYGCNINDYISVPKVNLKAGFVDDDLYIIKDKINSTFLSVIKTNVLKTYKHYYKAVSPKYSQFENVVVTFRIKDDVPPIVEVTSIIKIDYGTTKIDYINHLNISDNETKDGEFKMVVNETGLNYQIIGAYEVYITVYDKSLNQTSVVVKVEIIDRIKPVIVLNKPLILEKDSPPNYHDYFIFKDNYHTTLDVIFIDELVDINTPGFYEIQIIATDISNNKNGSTQVVEVRDTTSPILNLKYHTITLAVHKDKFMPNDAVYSMFDGLKPLPKEQLVIEGEFNINEIGNYEITYTLKDLYSNKTVKIVNVIVDDKEAPVLDADVLELALNTTEIDFLKGVNVFDNYDNNALKNLKVFDHNINVNVVGIYYINYECFDSRGNYTYFTRTVKVVEPIKKQTNHTIIYSGVVILILGLSIGGYGLLKYQKKKGLS